MDSYKSVGKSSDFQEISQKSNDVFIQVLHITIAYC